MKKYYVAGIVALLLQGCGGSSGSSSSTISGANSGGAVDPQGLIIRGDLSPAHNQSVALVASFAGQMSDKADIQWTKVSGPDVELVATNSAVLAFDLEIAGAYEFSVSFTTNDNKKHSQTVSFNTTSETNILNVRRDHAAREGNKVSLKLSAPRDPGNPLTGDVVDGNFTNVIWQQTAGPSVTLDSANTNELLAIFKAPSVTKDELITFSVSAMHPNGQTFTDNVYVLVQDINTIPGNAYFDETVAKVQSFDSNSSRAQALEQCIYTNYLTHACSFSEVNLIGQAHEAPSVDDIMSRVLVSHQWMGDNFKLFLENEDSHGDFRTLLRSVSAIVISYDIRPSFYTSATGAIYLDPENLWLTPGQRDVIDVAPDYRSAFGQELQYVMPWRYVKDNDYAGSFYPKDLRFNRTTADIVPDLASLLYHELAHAVDNFPPTTLGDITESSIFTEVNKRSGTTIADQLTATHPKQSEEMAALGQVNFRGATPTALQKSYLPEDIVQFFSNDSAPTEYAYSSEREDVATLFDATMMSARYGIERDEAVTPPYDASIGSDSLVISWGQRGRIKDALVEPRAKFVLERLMPTLDAQAIMASLPPVRSLPVGASWTDALDLIANNDKSSRQMIKLATPMRYQRPITLDIKQKHK